MRILVPAADLVTPNRFELAMLSGHEVADLAGRSCPPARRCGQRARASWSRPACHCRASPTGLGVLADAGDEAWLVTTPRRPVALGGTGDTFSALFLGHYLRSRDLRGALERAVSAVFALVERSCETGADELPLVALQDQLAAPVVRFAAAPVA